MAFRINIENETTANENYRKVIHTSKHQQLVVMSLLPTEDIPEEVHKEHDQFIRIESGTALATINTKNMIDPKNINDKIKLYRLISGEAIIIPAGAIHKITNITDGKGLLKLYTIYSPPEHAPDRVDVRRPVD
jgi:mannose-6-phosphate isomerase-like protein (cupin superfamily)